VCKRHFHTRLYIATHMKCETKKRGKGQKKTETSRSIAEYGVYSVPVDDDGKSQPSPALPSTDLHHQSQLGGLIHRALNTLTLEWLNSGFPGRNAKRQYPRPRQVIIGSTLAPGRLVNWARVHALVMTSASRSMTSHIAGNIRADC
jgi:hypothetical protein